VSSYVYYVYPDEKNNMNIVNSVRAVLKNGKACHIDRSIFCNCDTEKVNYHGMQIKDHLQPELHRLFHKIIQYLFQHLFNLLVL
jgi:hypothetical protein